MAVADKGSPQHDADEDPIQGAGRAAGEHPSQGPGRAADASPHTVTVVYALPDEQAIVTLPFRDRMTAAEAVAESGLEERFAAIDERPLVLGIFGLRVDSGQTLEPGDRVEICRPLLADPRDMRRDLLAGGKVMGGRTGGEPPTKKAAK